MIAGVNICELDPEDDSVGYGGLPNAEGVVQLDASCMHGPKQARGGGGLPWRACARRRWWRRAVMDLTDHHLLVGKGAQDFARNMGFTIEADLNTPKSRAAVAGVEAADRPRPLSRRPRRREEASRKISHDLMREGLIESDTTAPSTATA